LIIKIFRDKYSNSRKIKKLNQYLNSASKIAQIGFWELDSKTGEISWSDTVYDIFELDNRDGKISYNEFLSYLPKEDVESLEYEFHLSIEEKRNYFTVHKLVTAKGNVKYVEERGKHYFDSSGKFIKTVGSIYDISATYFSNKKFKYILEYASDGIHILDESGNLIEFSNSFASNLGYTIDEIKRLSIFDWDVSIPKYKLKNAIKELIDSPKTFETKHKRKDGTIIDVQISAKNIELNGKTYLYASQRDITQEKINQKIILEKTKEQEILLSLFDIGDSVLFRWKNDENWSIVYVSENVEKLLGYSRDELLSSKVLYSDCIYISDLDKVIEDVENNRDNIDGFFHHKPYRVVTKDGLIKWVYDQTVIEKDADGNITHFIGYIIDMTKEKEYEIALKKQRDELDELNSELEHSLINLKSTTNLYENEKLKYKTILDLASDGIFLMDMDGKLVEYSNRVIEFLGYSRDEIDNLSIYDWDRDVTKDDFVELIKALENYPTEIERVHTRKDGSTYIAYITATLQKIGDKSYIYASVRDITEQKKNQKRLEDSEFRWKFAIEGSSNGLWDWNVQSGEVYFSPQWKKMLGFREDEIENNLEEWENRVHPDDLENVYKDINNYFDGKSEIYSNEHRVLCKDGLYKWILDRGAIVQRDKDNKPLRVIGTHTDINDIRKAMETIKKQSYIDVLTQLHNRKAYNERIEELLAKYRRYGNTFSILMFDIDHFKSINDTYGHIVGDEVLVKLSKVVLSIVRKSDYIYRVGGEEFIILLSETKLKDASICAQKVRSAIETQVDVIDNREVTISIGVTEVKHNDDEDSIFSRVDKNLYYSKENGRNRVSSDFDIENS
jgi:diguanylate cyclase (GGDEF)-like protein/PAS domain S-box-containing protein